MNSLVKYNNTKIEDIGLTFTLPGYNDYELKRGGADLILTIRNVEEYVCLIYDKLVNGQKCLIDSFKTGFNKVFPVENLKCFTSTELEEVICGCSQESWDMEVLLENILPTHGLDKGSMIYRGLLDIIMGMSNLDKKKFLLFVTGSPRLPLGGIYFFK